VEEEVQRMANRQAREILSAPKAFTPVGPLLKESGVEPAACTFNYKQRRYATRLLNLPDNHPAKEMLPVTPVYGDLGQSDDDNIWMDETKTPGSIDTRLAQQLGREAVESCDGVKRVTTPAKSLVRLPYKVLIETESEQQPWQTKTSQEK
jgi:hypothetical protein